MLRVCRKHEYTPTVFIEMRRQLGTARAVSRLVQAGENQAGFRRMVDLDLADWTAEAAVLKFPCASTRDDIACTQSRLA